MTSGNIHLFSSRGRAVNTAVTKTFDLDAVAGDGFTCGSATIRRVN